MCAVGGRAQTDEEMTRLGTKHEGWRVGAGEMSLALVRNRVGGINHCHTHCRLAKFRGFMYGV
jgi:hypothetical protein